MEATGQIAIVDLETTGPHLDQGDAIIQIGAVIIQKGEIIHEYDMLINPEREIPSHITQLTGISQDMVASAPRLAQVVKLWHQRLKDCIFVAHNIDFDLRILKQVFKSYDLEFNPLAIDTVKLAKVFMPTAKGFNLIDLSEKINCDYLEAHQAIQDARMTGQLLSYISQEIQACPKELLVEMRSFVSQLDHNEVLVLDHPDLFILNSSGPSKGLNGNEFKWKGQQENSVEDLIPLTLKWIQERIEDHPRVVVEDEHLPIPDSFIEAFTLDLLKKDQTLMVTVDDVSLISSHFKTCIKEMNKKIAFYCRPNHLIDPQKFKSMVKQSQPEKANQQELVIVAGLIYWFSKTETGDLNELHPEFTSNPLVEGLSPTDKLALSNPYFRRMLSKLKQADIIIFRHYDWIQFQTMGPKFQTLLEGRKLLVNNIDGWIHQARRFEQVKLDISDWFSQLHALKHWIDQAPIGSYIDKTGLNQSLESIYQIIDLINQFWRDDAEKNEGMYHSKFLSYEDPLYKRLVDKLKQVQMDLANLMNQMNLIQVNEISSVDRDRLNFLFIILKSIKKFFKDRRASSYLIIQADIIRGQAYHISIYQRSLKLNHIQEFLEKQSGIFFSKGDYRFRQSIGPHAWLNLGDLAYEALTFKRDFTYTIQVPSFYQTKTDLNTEELGKFLNNQEAKLPDRLVMIVNSLDQVRILNTALSHSGMNEKYMLLAEGNHGSLKRIQRSFNQGDRVILIIHWKSFLNMDWQEKDIPTDIYLLKLPFLSFDSPSMKAIEYYYGDTTLIFDNQLLPHMIQNLKDILIFSEAHFNINDFFLFDDRVFTQSYSSRIQSALADEFIFTLFDDYQ